MEKQTFVTTGYTNNVELCHEYGEALDSTLLLYPTLEAYNTARANGAPHDFPVKVTVTYELDVKTDAGNLTGAELQQLLGAERET